MTIIVITILSIINNNTCYLLAINYLVGVTRARAISVLSPGWVAAFMTKEITSKSGLFPLLEPKDKVFAD